MMDAGGALIIIVGVLLAVAAGGDHGVRLDKMQRARQPDSPEDWIHDTAARNRTRTRIRHSTPQRLELDWECGAGADGSIPGRPCSVAPHRHVSSQEMLTLTSGRLGLMLDGETRLLESQGATVEIPRGAAHTYWSADPARSLQLVVTVTPAGEAERWWKTAFGLGHDYGTPEQVPFLQRVVTAGAGDAAMADVSPLRWRVYTSLAAFVARVCGYRPFEDDYPTDAAAAVL